MNESAAPPVVLVADDEPTMLELVARHLRSIEQPKMEVIEASDGDEAWRLARERLPDLVVLDVMMPGMSGWEVCRKIRQDAALAHTGVLMLTGIGESLNEATSPLFGADEYIDKPFEFESLDEKIDAILRQRAAQREAVPRPVAIARDGGASEKKRPGGGSKPKATRVARSAVGGRTQKGKRTMAAKKGAKRAAKKTAKKSARAAAPKPAKKLATKAAKTAKKAATKTKKTTAPRTVGRTAKKAAKKSTAKKGRK